MRKIRILTISILFSLAATSGFAADGLALMKIESGARALGMGSAFVSVGGDVYSSAYNPAGATGISKFTASFGHTLYWENVRLESGFFATNLSSKINMHGHIRFAAVDDLEGRLGPTSEFEAFDAHDISFKTGLSYSVSPKLSAGLAIGMYVEKIEAWRGKKMNVDLGLLYNLSPVANVGASVTSLGSDFTLSKNGFDNSRPIELPTTARLGGSYNFKRYLAALDLVFAGSETHAHLGAEADIHPLFDLRAGYMAGYESKNFSTGFSFTRRNLVIDYAFVPYSNELGSSHLFNLTFTL